MPLNWLGNWRLPYIELPARQLEGWLVLALYGVGLFLLLVSQRRAFARLNWRHWAVLFGLLVLAVFLNNFLPRPYWGAGASPVPGRPQEMMPPFVPLLGLAPVLLAGMGLGVGPALVVGLAAGSSRAAFGTGALTQAAEAVIFGAVASFLTRQNYRDRVSAVLRQPLVAGVIGGCASWLFVLPSIYLYTQESVPVLYALDYSWTVFLAAFGPTVLMGALAGAIAQGVYIALPAWRPVQSDLAPPPYARSLSARLLFIFVPLILLVVGVLLYAVTTTALDAATRQAVAQMARDAASATDDVPYFFQTGQSLMDSFAADERLRSADEAVRQQRLAESVRAGAFFDQLLLFDRQGQALSHYPPDVSARLTEEELVLLERVLSSGAPQFSQVHMRADNVPIVSFIVQVPDATGEQFGALLGRARLDINPIMSSVSRGLQQTLGAGEGFLLDEQGRIVIHPHPERRLATWALNPDLPALLQAGGGTAFVYYASDGLHRLLYVRPVSGLPWTAIIELPYAAVLGLAAQISTPLLILLIGLVIVASAFVALASRWVTRPLATLARASQQIAEGKLDSPVTVGGDDEVGRLGQSFEQMRQRLRGQLADLSLLLRVSQEVAAASLDVQRGIPPILKSALQASPAQCCRLVILTDDGAAEQVISAGQALEEGLTPLDRALAVQAGNLDEPWLFETLARVRNVLSPAALWPNVRSLAAFVVRRRTRPLGVLWLAYNEPHHFTESEVNLLTTLAGQAAVVVENARLFLAAEDGRQRLLAILNSTSDAVIVTDPQDRILFLNPAAETAFGVKAAAVSGMRLPEAINEPTVIQLLTTVQSREAVHTGEVPLPDGRTLYGSASAIVVNDPTVKERRHIIGRVAVMRDVTHFKELDSLKSQFVATVSHDLRSPLTYMRGYTTMLPMVGSLNEKQHEYIDKISAGIQQMTELIDDLLDLGRIEAGVGIQRQPCMFGDVIREAADEMRGQAVMRGLELNVEINSRRSSLADPALLKRAVTNLIDNACKYTPAGGTVTVRLDELDNSFIFYVKDTGIGIAPSDQARLFERFYRVKRRETLDIKGSGLGLAIVKSIAEWHGGRVWVESQLGVGSTFYMAIPIVAAES